MFGIMMQNLELSCKMLNESKRTEAEFAEITENEETIDYLNKVITEALVDITAMIFHIITFKPYKTKLISAADLGS